MEAWAGTQRLTRLAGRHDGVVTRRQVLARGVGRHALERLVARGLLHRVHTGVFAVGPPGATWQEIARSPGEVAARVRAHLAAAA